MITRPYTLTTISSTTLSAADVQRPVSVAEFKDHARVASDHDDVYIESLLDAAARWVERSIPGGRAVALRQYDYVTDRFPDSSLRLELPRPPLSAVVKIGYYTTANTTTILASTDYVAVTPTDQPGYVFPRVNTIWPSVETRPDAVQIRFTAGYGAPANIPAPIKHAVKIIAAHWYEHREPVGEGMSEAPFSVKALLGVSGWGSYA